MPLAAVRDRQHAHDLGTRSPEFLQNGSGAIRRSVIDNNYFTTVDFRLLQKMRQHPLQLPGTIVRRNDDAKHLGNHVVIAHLAYSR